jgi:hypothetical protein
MPLDKSLVKILDGQQICSVILIRRTHEISSSIGLKKLRGIYMTFGIEGVSGFFGISL